MTDITCLSLLPLFVLGDRYRQKQTTQLEALLVLVLVSLFSRPLIQTSSTLGGWPSLYLDLVRFAQLQPILSRPPHSPSHVRVVFQSATHPHTHALPRDIPEDAKINIKHAHLQWPYSPFGHIFAGDNGSVLSTRQLVCGICAVTLLPASCSSRVQLWDSSAAFLMHQEMSRAPRRSGADTAAPRVCYGGGGSNKCMTNGRVLRPLYTGYGSDQRAAFR